METETFLWCIRFLVKLSLSIDESFFLWRTFISLGFLWFFRVFISCSQNNVYSRPHSTKIIFFTLKFLISYKPFTNWKSMFIFILQKLLQAERKEKSSYKIFNFSVELINKTSFNSGLASHGEKKRERIIKNNKIETRQLV